MAKSLPDHSGFPWDHRAIAAIEDAPKHEDGDPVLRRLRVCFHTGGSVLIEASYSDGPCLRVVDEVASDEKDQT